MTYRRISRDQLLRSDDPLARLFAASRKNMAVVATHPRDVLARRREIKNFLIAAF
jgi:hypothetical protein